MDARETVFKTGFLEGRVYLWHCANPYPIEFDDRCTLSVRPPTPGLVQPPQSVMTESEFSAWLGRLMSRGCNVVCDYHA